MKDKRKFNFEGKKYFIHHEPKDDSYPVKAKRAIGDLYFKMGSNNGTKWDCLTFSDGKYMLDPSEIVDSSMLNVLYKAYKRLVD